MNNRKSHEQFPKQVSPWQWFPSFIFPFHSTCNTFTYCSVPGNRPGSCCKCSLGNIQFITALPTSSPPTMSYLRINCYCIAAAETWLATCKPWRGIFKRVCGRLSNCDSVWLLTVGSAQLKLQANPSSMGKLLVSINGFLVCFSFYSLVPSLCLCHLSSWFTEKKVSLLCSLQIRIYCGLGWHSDSNY